MKLCCFKCGTELVSFCPKCLGATEEQTLGEIIEQCQTCISEAKSLIERFGTTAVDDSDSYRMAQDWLKKYCTKDE